MTTPTPPPSPRLRWKFPVVVIALAVLVILALHHHEWVESYKAAYGTAFISALTILGLLIWFAFLSGLRPRTRLRGSLVIIALIVGALVAMKATMRIEGTVSGVGVPRLVWKWTPRAGQNTPALTDVPADSAHPVDLNKTTLHDFPQFLGP